MSRAQYDTREARRLAFLITLGLAAILVAWNVSSIAMPGVDLLPLWLAGKFWAIGQPDLIYTTSTPAFTLATPDAWLDMAHAEGVPVEKFELYPYIYAPLWAVAISPLTELMTFSSFDLAFRVINPALLVATPWLIWRAAPIAHPALIIGAGVVLLTVTTVGILPIMGNQVQIGVSFLLALTMERSRNHAPVAAGAALGLAAALKLYPALFVLLFLSTRQPRALFAFVVVGGGLGAASVVLAGWPLHQELLDELSVISHTVLQINLSANFDSLVATVLGLEFSQVLGGRPALVKPAFWVAISQLALVAFICALALIGRYRPQVAQHVLFWPFAVSATALLSPLAWTFHYIMPMSAGALLLALWGPRAAAIFLACIAAMTSILTLSLPFPAPGATPPLQFWSCLAFLFLTMTYAATLLVATRISR